MTEKRFTADNFAYEIWDNDEFLLSFDQTVDLLNKLNEENEQLKKENKKFKKEKEELLYQIGEAGKNNKTCRECECFISKIKYCYMWDMEVEADDVVVACDQRKVKNVNKGD